MLRTTTKFITLPLLVALFTLSTLNPVARAAVIDTQAILNQANNSTRVELQKLLAREDVRQQLIAYGVDPDDADRRIGALTSHELNQLQHHIDVLPAGSDALAVLGIIFLVLIVLELVGVTNVFSKL